MQPMIFSFKDAELHYVPGVELFTKFPSHDNRSWGAYPHQTPHYREITRRLGYGDDIWAYCFEHEFCHSFLADELAGRPSRILLKLAHGIQPWPQEAVQEEALVQTFQRWLRTHERPIISDADWDGLKARALQMLEVTG